MTYRPQVERLLKSQATIRDAYRRGDIDAAIAEYDRAIRPSVGAVDHRINRLAVRLARSFIRMADDDLASADGEIEP